MLGGEPTVVEHLSTDRLHAVASRIRLPAQTEQGAIGRALGGPRPGGGGYRGQEARTPESLLDHVRVLLSTARYGRAGRGAAVGSST